MSIRIKIVCDVCNEDCELISVGSFERAKSRSPESPLELHETEYRIRCENCMQKIKDLEDELEQMEDEAQP